jgi:hypothetical protein
MNNIEQLRKLLQSYLIELDNLEKNGETEMMDFGSLVDGLYDDVKDFSYNND